MVSRAVCLVTLFGVALAACADTPNAVDVVDTSETTTTTVEATITTTTVEATTTTVEATTTTTAEAVDPELVAAVKRVFDEWNSGDTARWRATFSGDAVQAGFGTDYPIDEFQDWYEFFAVLGEQVILGNCEAVDDIAVKCAATSANLWSGKISTSLTEAVHTFTIEDGLIVRYAANHTGAGTARSEWIKFADWVEETYGVDIGGFPGTAEGATLALDYMDEWAEETNG